jgi:hypothetical protein
MSFVAVKSTCCDYSVNYANCCVNDAAGVIKVASAHSEPV